MERLFRSRRFSSRQNFQRRPGSEVIRLSRRQFRRPIVIKTSTIPGAGMGAFANENFSRGTILGQQIGRKCDLNANGDYVLSVEGYNEDGQYIRKCIDAEDLTKSNWTRYINSIRAGDGRTKNAQFRIVGQRIGVQAITDIPRGTEILVDQGNEQW